MADDASAAVVRPASTVIMLRDGAEGIETYVMRRAPSMAFAPGMYVFPGGRVDAIDTDGVRLQTDGPGLEKLAARASTDVGGVVALYSCALRETAEETGVVLAPVGDDARPVLDPVLLPIVGHWVTPETEKRRYDVRFFATLVGLDQAPLLTTTEGDHADWVTPEKALADFMAGTMAMLPPTVTMLRLLLGYADAAAALAAAAERPVLPVLPKRIFDEAGGAHWSLINDRTGEVIVPEVAPPRPSETLGIFDIPVQATEQ